MTTVTAEQISRIIPLEVQELRRKGADLVIVDARSTESFRSRHVSGAISIPKEELDQRHEILSPEQHIVLYCT